MYSFSLLDENKATTFFNIHNSRIAFKSTMYKDVTTVKAKRQEKKTAENVWMLRSAVKIMNFQN